MLRRGTPKTAGALSHHAKSRSGDFVRQPIKPIEAIGRDWAHLTAAIAATVLAATALAPSGGLPSATPLRRPASVEAQFDGKAGVQ